MILFSFLGFLSFFHHYNSLEYQGFYYKKHNEVVFQFNQTPGTARVSIHPSLPYAVKIGKDTVMIQIKHPTLGEKINFHMYLNSHLTNSFIVYGYFYSANTQLPFLKNIQWIAKANKKYLSFQTQSKGNLNNLTLSYFYRQRKKWVSLPNIVLIRPMNVQWYWTTDKIRANWEGKFRKDGQINWQCHQKCQRSCLIKIDAHIGKSPIQLYDRLYGLQLFTTITSSKALHRVYNH